jgi:hypothetical protein
MNSFYSNIGIIGREPQIADLSHSFEDVLYCISVWTRATGRLYNRWRANEELEITHGGPLIDTCNTDKYKFKVNCSLASA